MVTTSLSSAGGTGLIPGQGARIPHASGARNQNRKQKQYCNKFTKDFKQKQASKQTKKHGLSPEWESCSESGQFQVSEY